MTHYDTCFELLIGHEGKLSLDPKDRGNWTDGNYGRSGGKLVGSMYGVSAMSYPRVDIRNLTLAQAKLIYKRDYWDRVEADTLEPALAFAAFDTAVNAGVGRARGYL